MCLSFVLLLIVAMKMVIGVHHWWDFIEKCKWKDLEETLFQWHLIHHRST